MIDQALDFICKQVNSYLRMKLDPLLDPSSPVEFIQLINVSRLQDNESGTGSAGNANSQNAYLSVVNIEEDRISKSKDNFIRKDGKVLYQNPKIHLNLYLLFSVNLSSYFESLKRLSYIIQFFQYQHVFTPLTSPAMPAGVEELILDLNTLSFQDLNNLWGILGSKYLPSVMYKMRMITISEDFAQGAAELITEIHINSKNLQL